MMLLNGLIIDYLILSRAMKTVNDDLYKYGIYLGFKGVIYSMQ